MDRFRACNKNIILASRNRLCSARLAGARVTRALSSGGHLSGDARKRPRCLKPFSRLPGRCSTRSIPEQAHELTLRSLEAGIYPRSSAPDDAPAGRERVGPRFPQSARHRRGLRQGRARGRSRARHGLRLRRDRHRHAAAAAGQSAPARLPADRGPRTYQPAGLQQRRPRRGAGAAPAPPAARHRRRQRRRQQGCARPRGRLRRRHPLLLRRGQLLQRQCLLAQHAGPARPAGARGARRSAGARAGGARAS